MDRKQTTPSPSNPPPPSSIEEGSSPRYEVPTSESRTDEKELHQQSLELPQDLHSNNQVSSSHNLQNTDSCSPSKTEKVEKVKISCSSLFSDEEPHFLEVGVSDLLCFSKKFKCAEDLVEQAISFAQVNEKWDFWTCCSCSTNFLDSESHFQHVMGNHLKHPFTLRVSNDWISIINNGNWEPADDSVVITILENKLPLISSKHCKGEEVPKLELKDYFSGLSWTLSDVSERAALLQKIQIRLQTLLSDKMLLKIHLDHVINQAMKELEGEFHYGSLRELRLDETHLCICLLGSSELRRINRFLKKCEKKGGLYAGLEVFNPSFETIENLVLNDKSFYVLLNERSLCDGSAKPASNIRQPESWADLRKERMVLGKEELIKFQEILEKGKEETVALEENLTINDEELNGMDNLILKQAEDIHQFENKINGYAAADYREFLLFLLKAYFEDKLAKIMKNFATCMSQDVAEDKHDRGDG